MKTLIDLTIQIRADRKTVWDQWTTKEGLESFLAPEVRIELKVGGAFEVFFAPDAPEGERGADGMSINALDPGRMLSFTWNAPPSIPEIRKQRTLVSISLEEVDKNEETESDPPETIVRLQNGFYGSSSEWRKAYHYFEKAWGEIVLPRLKSSLEKGPVDWTAV